jgi:hypothetical protein
MKRFYWFGLSAFLLVVMLLRVVGLSAAGMLSFWASQFGPHLYLISTGVDELPANLPPTVVLHAQLHTEMGNQYLTHYLASGGEADGQTIAASGLAVRLLDADTSGKVYYFAEATAANASALAARFGQVIYTNAQVLLIAAPAANEQGLLETLLAEGVALAALTADPLHLQRADELLASQMELAEATGANPAIADLLPLLTEADLTALLRELSGEVTVHVDGVAVDLNTRYTLSSQIQDAEHYLFRYYSNLGLTPSYFEWTWGSYRGRNVMAEIRGVTHPERIWIVGGHFDTISNASYTSAPGADDNGTGTAATMLIAKILHNYRFADTIRFVHFSGEEQGQWGSKRYASYLNQIDAQVLGFLNLDMIGYDGNHDRKVEVHTGMGPRSNALGAAFINNNDEYGQGLVIEQKRTSASRFSDHSPFWDNNFPAFLAIEDFFDNVVTGDRDRNPQYHRTGDQLNLVDVSYVARTGRLALATVAELAVLHLSEPGNTPTATPTVTRTPTPTATATPPPVGCTDILVNGNFEVASGWQFGSTPFTARIVSSAAHSGAYSVRLGIPPGDASRLAHSSAFQRVTLPTNAQQILLHFWQRPGGGSDGVDYRESLLLNSGFGFLAKLERSLGSAPTEQWNERLYDLTTYRGRTVVVYFNVYNNGRNNQMWNYVDDVALLVCNGVERQAAPTPAESDMPEATPTLVPTAPATPTLLPTAPADGSTTIHLPVVMR